jgi:hypothetical protein
MSIQVFRNIKEAISNLNPDEIRQHAERPVRLFLYADTEADYARMEDFFAPRDVSEAKRRDLRYRMYRASDRFLPSSKNDLEIFFNETRDTSGEIKNAFSFSPDEPQRLISDVLKRRPDLAIPLALNVLPFRREVSSRVVKKVSRENAMFALATAIPDIIPFISLPWAIGEFASDTAVLTANQIRMAFILAAANDRDIGYREQRGEIATIILGAFGWRALARELVGKIPLGGGLIPKAAIAYAGTRVSGLSLERYYRFGYRYTRDERRQAYEEAFERGKRIATTLLAAFRERRQAET